jgi:predicted RNase H-like nuclease (RuvC/YqgF family)
VHVIAELNEKDSSFKDHRLRVNNLGEQLDLLQKDVQAREVSQMQLKDIVIRIETDIMDEVAKAFEIAMLRGEIRILSAHWTNKTKNLESQLCYISSICS